MPIEERWDVKDNGKVFSYLSLGRVKRLISKGIIKEDYLIWHSGLSGWRKAGEVDELKTLFQKVKEE